MKKFQFSLSAALKLRESQLQVERIKLQKLFAEEQSLTNAIDRLVADRRDAASFIYGQASVNAEDLRTLSCFSVGADARAIFLREQLARHAKSIQEQKARLMQAERRVKLLGKLRNRKFEAWTEEANREIEVAAQESWLSKRHSEIVRQATIS